MQAGDPLPTQQPPTSAPPPQTVQNALTGFVSVAVSQGCGVLAYADLRRGYLRGTGGASAWVDYAGLPANWVKCAICC